jgi:hypothetical protein
LRDGTLLASHNNPASSGAFVATVESATVETLDNGDWRTRFQGKQDALASYPVLTTPGGPNTNIRESH